MLSDYSILEEAGTFIVEWARPTLPIEIKAIALLLLAILPFLYIFLSLIHISINGLILQKNNPRLTKSCVGLKKRNQREIIFLKYLYS